MHGSRRMHASRAACKGLYTKIPVDWYDRGTSPPVIAATRPAFSRLGVEDARASHFSEPLLDGVRAPGEIGGSSMESAGDTRVAATRMAYRCHAHQTRPAHADDP